jgi:hypothetical protein
VGTASPPSIKYKRVFIQMLKGLHVIDRRVLRLMNKYSIYRGVFKYKEKNLGVLYAPLGQSLCLQLTFCKTLKEKKLVHLVKAA